MKQPDLPGPWPPEQPRCRICGRRLKDRESIARKAGPVCAGKTNPNPRRKRRAL